MLKAYLKAKLVAVGTIAGVLASAVATHAQSVDTTLFPVASGTNLLVSSITLAASVMLTYLAYVVGVGITIGALVWAWKALHSRFGGKGKLKHIK